jgi:tyrosine-specific transport protein
MRGSVRCWTQLTTGLLLAEVNAATLCELGNGGVSLTSMSTRTLGRVGTTVSGVCYVLLHYALLVAYISRAGAFILRQHHS